MTRLQFGDYVFAHNPRKLEISRAQSLAVHQLPGRGMRTQALGMSCRAVRCEGEIFAADAAGSMAKLAGLFDACGGGAKELYLPTGERFFAFAGRVGYLAQGDGRVITYTVEFTEERTGEAT